MSEFKRSLVVRRSDPARARQDHFKSFLLASAVGLGLFASSSASAQQASAVTGGSPASASADASSLSAVQPAASDTASSIITLAGPGGPVQAAAAADGSGNLVLAQNTTATAASTAATPASATEAPYTNFDAKLGTNPLVRFYNYQKLELGLSSAPVDPTAPAAPASSRDGWPVVPQTTPPMPFTDWPYGGTTLIGDNRTASIDSPLMVAIENTSVGKWMSSTGIQAYGWVDYGGNISTSRLKAGNAPAAYDYNPNNIQLDQLVLYVERTPDTVQTDHVDWGFRFSTIYGENYRYTTSYGLASYQLLNHNDFYGYDFPMVYGELWVPKIMEGLMIRVGRYISLPDIEAQLAPNNYMYTHSITYTLDNYTNTGIQTTLAVTKQILLQVGYAVGTETTIWNGSERKPNLFVQQGLGADPLYPGTSFQKDPGNQPSVTVCGRYQSLDGKNDVNVCADAINKGQWGYNNLQWYGMTAYHTFNKYWHISYEIYEEHQDGVPNAKNPEALNIYNNGGTPFSPQFIPFNAPYLAQCKNPAVLRCNAEALGTVFYLNYSPDHLDNISFRGEYYDDMEGQRTGAAAVYYEGGIGWQHWLSPQIELRPEVVMYHSSVPSFDLGTKKYQTVFSGDIIWHF